MYRPEDPSLRAEVFALAARLLYITGDDNMRAIIKEIFENTVKGNFITGFLEANVRPL